MWEIVEEIHQLEIPMRRNPLGKTYSHLLRYAGPLLDFGIPTKEDLDAFEARHGRRCEAIIAVLRGNAETVFEMSSVVSWNSKSWNEMEFLTKRMAAAMTYAQLIYLRNRGRVGKRLRGEVRLYAAA